MKAINRIEEVENTYTYLSSVFLPQHNFKSRKLGTQKSGIQGTHYKTSSCSKAVKFDKNVYKENMLFLLEGFASPEGPGRAQDFDKL